MLFAVDTTLIEKKSEIEKGKQTVMEFLGRFEEICHPDKEEYLALGTANDIRILGSYADRKIDPTMRLQRMRRAAQTCVDKHALSQRHCSTPQYVHDINQK